MLKQSDIINEKKLSILYHLECVYKLCKSYFSTILVYIEIDKWTIEFD